VLIAITRHRAADRAVRAIIHEAAEAPVTAALSLTALVVGLGAAALLII